MLSFEPYQASRNKDLSTVPFDELLTRASRETAPDLLFTVDGTSHVTAEHLAAFDARQLGRTALAHRPHSNSNPTSYVN